MTLIEFSADDADLIDQTYDLLKAAHEADRPENPHYPERFFRTLFTAVFPGRERAWFGVVEGGRLAAWARVDFFTDDSLDLGVYELAVHPGHRGGGAAALLRDRIERYCLDHGRTTVLTAVPVHWEGGPDRDPALYRELEARGYARALTTVNRRSPVDPLGAAAEEQRYRGALAKAGDAYEVRQWIGPVPEELLGTMTRMESMIYAEVPMGDIEVEPEVMTPEKVRAKEAVNAAEGRTWVASVAVERTTGEVRGWTKLAVDEGDDRNAMQGITMVDPAHRGHGLGLLLKLVNLRRLRAYAPSIRWIWTDNADVNAPMIAINEMLGYETVDANAEYQKKLKA